MEQTKNNVFYAIAVGTYTGIYTNWDECKNYVLGVSGSKYKKFKTMEEAENYMKEHDNKTINEPKICIQDEESTNINDLMEEFAETLKDNKKLKEMLEVALTRRNMIFHAPGGCGKSHALKELSIMLSTTYKVFATATTGVAAVNLANGHINSNNNHEFTVTTLHRFAGIGTANLDIIPLIKKVRSNRKSLNRWKSCEILIIDEISMLGGGLFQKLDKIAKSIKGNNKPFGGIQLIVSGDFLQLPPVKDTWIFHTTEWEDLNLRPFILETPYRYDNMDFFNMLLRIRKGILTETDSKILYSRVKANECVHNILNKISSDSKQNIGEIIKPTMFYSKRDDVESFNLRELDKLEGEEYLFEAEDEFETNNDFESITGFLNSYDEEGSTRDEYKKLLDYDMPRSISFKIGAQVMLRANLSVETGLVNGSRGVVNSIIPREAVIVKFLNGAKVKIELHSRSFEDKYIKATRKQIPLILSYACTIHRSQGSTLDYAVVDLGYSVFSEGQAYVALSRCRNIKGLFISNFVPQSIKASRSALEYAKELEKKEFEERFGCGFEVILLMIEILCEYNLIDLLFLLIDKLKNI